MLIVNKQRPLHLRLRRNTEQAMDLWPLWHTLITKPSYCKAIQIAGINVQHISLKNHETGIGVIPEIATVYATGK